MSTRRRARTGDTAWSVVPVSAATLEVAVFDLDGTLVDSDAALDGAFRACGVPEEEITHGHVLAHECARLGIAVEDYLDAYDPGLVTAFRGVEELVAGLDRWAVCSNKHGRIGPVELARLGWRPEVALFADAFDGPKRLEPVLDAMGVAADRVLFVGDTPHDRDAARVAGCRFLWAGWNLRVRPAPDEEVATEPCQVLAALGGQVLA